MCMDRLWFSWADQTRPGPSLWAGNCTGVTDETSVVIFRMSFINSIILALICFFRLTNLALQLESLSIYRVGLILSYCSMFLPFYFVSHSVCVKPYLPICPKDEYDHVNYCCSIYLTVARPENPSTPVKSLQCVVLLWLSILISHTYFS